MNKVLAVGRLTKDPVTKYNNTGDDWTGIVTTFTLALDRGKKKDGTSAGADYLPCKIWGKSGENLSRYMAKGYGIEIEGHMVSGSFEKRDGTKEYTLECVVDKWFFLPQNPHIPKEEIEAQKQARADVAELNDVAKERAQEEFEIPTGFNKLDDDSIPF